MFLRLVEICRKTATFAPFRSPVQESTKHHEKQRMLFMVGFSFAFRQQIRRLTNIGFRSKITFAEAGRTVAVHSQVDG